MLNLAGNEFDEYDLIRRVVRGLRPQPRKPQYRWVLVMETFCVGCTVANALCREFDLDPDEVLRSDTP